MITTTRWAFYVGMLLTVSVLRIEAVVDQKSVITLSGPRYGRLPSNTLHPPSFASEPVFVASKAFVSGNLIDQNNGNVLEGREVEPVNVEGGSEEESSYPGTHRPTTPPVDIDKEGNDEENDVNSHEKAIPMLWQERIQRERKTLQKAKPVSAPSVNTFPLDWLTPAARAAYPGMGVTPNTHTKTRFVPSSDPERLTRMPLSSSYGLQGVSLHNSIDAWYHRLSRNREEENPKKNQHQDNGQQETQSSHVDEVQSSLFEKGDNVNVDDAGRTAAEKNAHMQQYVSSLLRPNTQSIQSERESLSAPSSPRRSSSLANQLSRRRSLLHLLSGLPKDDKDSRRIPSHPGVLPSGGDGEGSSLSSNHPQQPVMTDEGYLLVSPSVTSSVADLSPSSSLLSLDHLSLPPRGSEQSRSHNHLLDGFWLVPSLVGDPL